MDRCMMDELIDLRSYSMKYNIIIYFNRNKFWRQPGEYPAAMARRFFKDVLQLEYSDDVYIPVAHFLGPSDTSPLIDQ